MDYKMIVLDLDGTLTNREKKITPRTKETLMEAQKRGKSSWFWPPAVPFRGLCIWQKN